MTQGLFQNFLWIIILRHEFNLEPRLPNQQMRQSFTDHFNRHLTTEAMSSYLLRCSNLEDARRILFIDENLSSGPDYLSLFTLIGLYQNPNVEVTSIVPVPYIWKNWLGNPKTLYGRGFGYTRVLDPALRGQTKQPSFRSIKRRLESDQFDAVVFGSIMRNLRLHAHLRSKLDPSRTILINGEDLQVDSNTLDALTSTKSNIFVRALG